MISSLDMICLQIKKFVKEVFFFFNIIIIVNKSREWSRKYSPQRKGIEGKVVCPFCGTGLRNDPRDSL